MSKLPSNIKKELLALNEIRPSSAWKKETHARLLQTLNVPESAKRFTLTRYARFASAYSREMLTKLAWQPIGALTLIAVVVVGPSMVTVNAAKGSLPGDALYPVKRSLERARISLTFSSTKRAELELNLVATRLHELQRITKEQAPSPEREQKIALAIEELKKDTTSVKTRLETAKTETQTTAQKTETLNLAKIIDEKTATYQETLEATISELHAHDQKPGNDLGQAISSVQEVAIDALDVLISSKDGENAISTDTLKTKVEQQLNVTKGTVETLRARLEVLVAAQTDTAETEEPVAETNTLAAPQEPAKPPVTAADLKKKFDEQIAPTVVYAEELLKLGDFTAALDSLAKTNKQVEALSKDVKTLQQTVEQKPVELTETGEEQETNVSTAEQEQIVEEESSTETESEPVTETQEEPASEKTEENVQQ